MAIATLLHLLLPFIVSCSVDAEEYPAFLAIVRWVPNNPEAVGAKDLLQLRFCNHFGVSPCSPSKPSGDDQQLHIVSDLTIHVPAAQLSKVALFLSQWRALVSRNGDLLSVKIEPVNSHGKAAAQDVSAQFGYWDHIVTDVPSPPSHNYTGPGDIDSIGARTLEPWTHQCTWSDICTKPYTPNTTCSEEVDAWHVHIQYSPNDLQQVRARDVFKSLATNALNMTWEDRCIDHQVEDKQPRLCWLTGPGGTDPVYPDHQGGSFVTVTFSIYVPAVHFASVLPWLMEYRNKRYLGADLDMMIHPESGCAWPDHIFWPLLVGHRWDANHYGITKEAQSISPVDPKEVAMPVSDPRSPKWVGRPTQTCSNTTSPSSYTLLLQYTQATRAQATTTLDSLKKFWRQSFGTDPNLKDDPRAFMDPNSPCAGPCATVLVSKTMLGALLAAMPDIRQTGVDLRLVPNGLGCQWREFMDFSLQSGDLNWALNDFAMKQLATVQNVQATTEMTQMEKPSAFIMYIIGEQTSAWSNTSLATFADAFAAAFKATRGECTPWLAEPKDYGDSMTNNTQLCMMEEFWTPYMDPYAMFPVIHVPIYIPSSFLAETLAWVLQHRHADKAGYELDIALVPLTGNATRDYHESLWWSGSKWKVNAYAVQKAMDLAPTNQVRFYRNSEAHRVVENGLERLEWSSLSGLGELDLAMGDPSAAVVDFKGPFPPSPQQQMRFKFDFQYILLEGTCNFTISYYNGSVHEDSLLAGDMIWIRAGVAHRIKPHSATSKVMAVGGPWAPLFVDFSSDSVYNFYEDAAAQGPPGQASNNSWYRSYHLGDQAWSPNPTIPDHLQTKMIPRSSDNNDDVAYLAVKWDPYQWLPRHTHATGAFYIVLEGGMHFPGEGSCGKFEARWTAPGHYYAGERSTGEGALITVLGADSPPQFVDVPPEGQHFQNYLEEKRRNMHHVYEDPAGVQVPLQAVGRQASQQLEVQVDAPAVNVFI